MRKPTISPSDQVRQNRPVQLRNQARSLGLYYPCSENKGVDQLCSYCTADLRFGFRIYICFSCAVATIVIMIIDGMIMSQIIAILFRMKMMGFDQKYTHLMDCTVTSDSHYGFLTDLILAGWLPCWERAGHLVDKFLCLCCPFSPA